MTTQKISRAEARHPIQVVARRSGLTADVLRAWEKRYSVVQPTRSPGGRRLYSNGDIERLILLREATDAGRRIGDVAALSTDELQEMVREDRVAQAGALSRPAEPAEPHAAAELLERALDAVRALDGSQLQAELRRATILLPPMELIVGVIAPLMERIGQLWWDGELGPSQEHLASAVVQQTLASVSGSLHPDAVVSRIVVATPAGQRHEIGASLVAAASAALGWGVTYLGADLPADEIVRAAHRVGVNAVALSLVHPADDPGLAEELRELRRKLDGRIAVIVGGRAAAGYRDTLNEIGATVLPDVASLRSTLERLSGSNGSNRSGD